MPNFLDSFETNFFPYYPFFSKILGSPFHLGGLGNCLIALVERLALQTPLFSKFKAQTRPVIPPPIIVTIGSSKTGAMNITCSWLEVFLRIDLLDVPYDDFLRFLEVGILLGWDVVQVRVRVLGKKVAGLHEGFRGWEMREEGKKDRHGFLEGEGKGLMRI